MEKEEEDIKNQKKGKSIQDIARAAWSWWEKNSHPLVALGTILAALGTFALAGFTVWHITEAQNMRKETKRLADICVEQFQIRAYPTFLLEFDKAYVESEKLIQKLKIENKGELTAHGVLVLFVSIYSQGKGKGYQFYNHQYVMLDKDGKKKSSLDFPSKIYPGAFKLYENQNPFPKGYSIETLKYALVYLKFKIPYKYKHAYERYGYMLHPPVHKLDSDKKYYLWGNIDLHLTNDLENQHLTSLKNTNLPSLEIVKNFFSDYPEYLDIKVAP